MTTAVHADARRRRKAPAVALPRPVVMHNDDVASAFDEVAELLATSARMTTTSWT